MAASQADSRNSSGIDIRSYLDRIGYSGPTDPTPDTLRQLHVAHLYTVPFENLDIHLRREITCDEQRFLHKIISLRRGGFCYELNGAFAALLRVLGFQVSLLSARVSREDGSASAEFDHLTLRVDLEEPWLADVGFGDSFLEPLRLETEEEQRESTGRIYRIVKVDGVRIVQRKLDDETWKPQYQSTLQPHRLEDFEARCVYQQTSPESHFTRQRICTLATPEGRITLSDLKWIRTIHGHRNEQTLKDDSEWRRVLSEYFGIRL
ncbi:MAG TPA: arylamine N-acetyltransferase [Terriglobales bacterium]|nr:arylamine N-acetyltransferase [Terriglobales bacterium]